MLTAPAVNGGFMPPNLPDGNIPLPPNVTYEQRFSAPAMTRVDELPEFQALQRGDIGDNVAEVVKNLFTAIGDLQRGITSGMTAFPVRENLEAEAKILVPLETPLRNMLPRTPGSGKASAWKVATGLGGGYGAKATLTAATDNASGQAVLTATANVLPLGFRVGDEVEVGTEPNTFIVTAISSATMTLSSNLTASQASKTVTKVNIADGAAGTSQVFFAEDGAPGTVATVYADRSATYKLLGTLGFITGFAMAAGANFQPQYMKERQHQLTNLMLIEEFALINSVSTDTNKPFGDGTSALGYDGLLASIATANGTPSRHIQTSVGALTYAHIDAQLTRVWRAGGRDLYIMCSGYEAQSIKNLAAASGSIQRVVTPRAEEMKAGFHISHYVHPITGELVPIVVNRFMPRGTMVFGAKYGPDGSPAADVDVLPQVQLPESAFDENIQGYTCQEIPTTATAPQVFYFLTSVYEVFRLKIGTVFAKSSGITS